MIHGKNAPETSESTTFQYCEFIILSWLTHPLRKRYNLLVAATLLHFLVGIYLCCSAIYYTFRRPYLAYYFFELININAP